MGEGGWDARGVGWEVGCKVRMINGHVQEPDGSREVGGGDTSL